MITFQGTSVKDFFSSFAIRSTTTWSSVKTATPPGEGKDIKDTKDIRDTEDTAQTGASYVLDVPGVLDALASAPTLRDSLRRCYDPPCPTMPQD